MFRLKMPHHLIWLLTILISIIIVNQRVLAGGLSIVAIQPAPRSLNASVTTAITIEFDSAVNPSTVNGDTFKVFGRWSGPKSGTYGFTNLDTTVIMTPTTPFSAGEPVMVLLSDQIEGGDGSPFPDSGFTFQFWTEAAPNDLDFNTIDVLSTRSTPTQSTRAYGGVATDMNNDGWLDLTIINEDSADVRVFLNRADGTGLYHDFLRPPSPVNVQASPNEPADFNGDGNADLAVANINADSVSILLGNGDGTFAPQQEITVGSAPRGLTVADVEGDGDVDVINTNFNGEGSISILLNNGSGVFGPPTFFESGGQNEWALTAADMNEDGILDLVIGAWVNGNAAVIINTGNGDGTFSFASSQTVGGTATVWMVNASDVNGDGHDDVATVNSANNTGTILLGDGAGNLGAPTTYPVDPFPLATDLGDIDGDGDLDWATSSFGGNWLLFLNDGSGSFTLAETFISPQAASCALMLDFDNNGILDLALIDELADEVLLVQNRPMITAPAINVSPSSLVSAQPVNTAVTQTLTISNLGQTDLNWSLAETACALPTDIPWLTAAPLSGTVPFDSSDAVAVRFDSTGMTAGVYADNLCINSDDPLNPTWTLPITMTVTDIPTQAAIAVSPATLSSTQEVNTAVTQTLTISSTGTADLTWAVHETTCAAPADIPWLNFAPLSGTMPVDTQTQVAVIYDTTAMTAGVYNETACITSNDPNNAEWPLSITLTVEEIKEPEASWYAYIPYLERP